MANLLATIFTARNLVVPRLMYVKIGKLTVVPLVQNLLKSDKSDGLITADEDIDLQLSLGIGTLTQVSSQMYFRALEGSRAK